MVGSNWVAHPSERLSQRTSRICCLPTTDKIELVLQAVEDVTFSAGESDAIAGLSISDCDVEVPTQHQISAATKRRDAIENLLHRADVSTFTGRPMNAEHLQRTVGPRCVPDLAAHHPAVEIRDCDR